MDANAIINALQEHKDINPSMRFNKKSLSPTAPGKKYRTWDIRTKEETKNFGCTKLEYHIKQDVPINLTTHRDSPQQNIDLARHCVTALLKDIFADAYNNNDFHPNNITQLFMFFKGLDKPFDYAKAGDDAKSLEDFHKDKDLMKKVVDKFCYDHPER
jgi:hypothetical protein